MQILQMPSTVKLFFKIEEQMLEQMQHLISACSHSYILKGKCAISMSPHKKVRIQYLSTHDMYKINYIIKKSIYDTCIDEKNIQYLPADSRQISIPRVCYQNQSQLSVDPLKGKRKVKDVIQLPRSKWLKSIYMLSCNLHQLDVR